MKYIKNLKFAFTLAEVLITIAIIGVVAALTIPGILQQYTEKALVLLIKILLNMGDYLVEFLTMAVGMDMM